ncbi:MAG TPA: hypothetical protein VK579_19330 [Terriglobales bacterium]|nr:hypothetical protein [Terriglobales bacterium]
MTLSDGRGPNSAVCSMLAMSLLLMSLTLVGCAPHQGMPSSEQTAPADQHLPFDGASDTGGIFPTDSLTPIAIPAGIPIAVRLRTSLSSATSRRGDSFEAVLDEPIVVRGKIVVPGGANLTGKVLDARAAGKSQEAGYMRLALTAVSLNGRSLPIQTSSIFVKLGSHREQNSTTLTAPPADGVVIGGVSTSGAAGNGKNTLMGATRLAASTAAAVRPGADHATGNKDVGLSAARRLTFRLAQPLPLGS